MIILGIETSCDETAAALVEAGRNILISLVSSQLDLHRAFGGVVPELASRAHLEALVPLIEESCRQSGVGLEDVGGVAFTRGPGLIGALLIGTAVAKAVAYARRIPLYGVHHLKAHLYAPGLTGASFAFPLVALIASGGHTVLVRADSWDDARVLGGTRDDAAGEAFDKVAALLGLGYPGGPAIEKAARGGNPRRFRFPRGMLTSGDLDFSFSGLKTAVRFTLQQLRSGKKSFPIADLAAGFQEAVVEVLTEKLKEAVRMVAARTVVVAGGVARNQALRDRLESLFDPERHRLLIPPLELCSDNAAMVAGLAFHAFRAGRRDDLEIDADPNLPWGKGLY